MRRRAYDKAIEDYGQAIALDLRLVAAYRSRGAAYFISESYDKALPDDDAVIRLVPMSLAATPTVARCAS